MAQSRLLVVAALLGLQAGAGADDTPNSTATLDRPATSLKLLQKLKLCTSQLCSARQWKETSSVSHLDWLGLLIRMSWRTTC